MLKKSNITNIQMLSDEWFMNRLARFTASENHYLCSDKFLTIDANKYVLRKVYEELSGLPSKDPVNTSATEHGHKYEAEGIREYGKLIGLEFVVVQKLIHAEGARFSATPDFLIYHNESQDKQFWNVTTGEVKCPLGENFMALALCKTPSEVLKVNKVYYYQVLFQMDACDSLNGVLVIYNPFVKVGKLNVINFRKLELRAEFKLIAERKIMAEQQFNKIRDEFLNR